MSVVIGVTWEGLPRPSLARSILPGLSPIAQDAIIFLNTVWLPPYSREVFHLKSTAETCGVAQPSPTKLNVLQPGPVTPPAAFVDVAVIRDLATKVGDLLDRARESKDTRVADNLGILFAFGGIDVSDFELVQLGQAERIDPLTSLTDDFRLTGMKQKLSRLLEDGCILRQERYGPYVFIRDDSPMVWGASVLASKVEADLKNVKMENFLKSRAKPGLVLLWQEGEGVLDMSQVAPLRSLGEAPKGGARQDAEGQDDEGQDRDLAPEWQTKTSCTKREGGLQVTLGLGRMGRGGGRDDLIAAQNLNMTEVPKDLQRYWRHTGLKNLLNHASHAGDSRVYVLVVSGLDSRATLKAIRHYATSLSKGSTVKEIVLVALDRSTFNDFKEVMKCSPGGPVEIELDGGLAGELNRQAEELMDQ